MLSSEFELSGFSLEDFKRLTDLFPNPFARTSEPAGLIALGRRDQLLGLWRAGHGRVDLATQQWPVALSELARQHDAPWVISLHPAALSELLERFGKQLRSDHSLEDQWLLLARITTELAAEAAINVWPRRLLGWGRLTSDNVARSILELLCPVGKALVLGAFDADGLHTSVTLLRSEGGFCRVLGPAALRERVGLLSGDFRRDYVHLLQAVELHVAPVAGGCFALSSTLRQLLHHPMPGGWSTAIAGRDVILQPLNPVLALPIGFDAGRAALSSMQSLATRILGSGGLDKTPLSPAVLRLKKLARGEQDLQELVGFDPVQALLELIKEGKGD